MEQLTREEIIYISQQIANLHGINIRIYQNTEKIFYQSVIDLNLDSVELCIDNILKDPSEIGYYLYDDYFYYSFVRYGDYRIILGFVSELEYSEQETRKIAKLMKVPPEFFSAFQMQVRSFCGIHLDTLLQITILLNFMTNRTMYDISDIRIKKSQQGGISSEIKKYNMLSAMDSDSYSNSSRIMSIELDMIHKVKNGDVQGLIEGASKIPAVSSGQLAPQMLRHQKNFFIRLETIISRAAYQAGIDADEILSTEEKYIRTCESLDSPDMLKNLQYHMVLDYASRVQNLNAYNESNSALVRSVANYIKTHICENIKISDIADALHKNRVNLTREFKKETGVNLSDYIQQKKIQEAKEILLQTNDSLCDIAYFLGFSSQSHFCRVFREITGETPAKFRKKHTV